MSGQWEVVGKKKDKGSKLPLPKSNNKQEAKNKKNLLNGVKIEDVLPKSQVQNLYSKDKNEGNNQPQKKSQEAGTKKQEKKVNKPQEPSKPKPPKSIESALNSINVEEFKSIFEKSKRAYPDAPIIWLKELVSCLNQKIPVEVQDTVFSAKPEGYPLNVVPSDLKSVIEKSVKEAGKSNAQLFFDIALTSMVTDKSKGLPGIGYKFYLQQIALDEPKLVTANINKHINLRNSYQNRANIALSILWAVGHVGFSDLHSGLAVFQELMLPLLEMKNYSRYVLKYLLDLIRKNDKSNLSKEEYLLILETIYSNKKNIPADLQKELSMEAPKLKSMLLRNPEEKYHSYVETFIKKLSSNSNESYQKCLCDVLVTIFTRDQITVANWNQIYVRNIAGSAVLLNYICDNFYDIKISRSTLQELLNNFTAINQELSLKKRKEDGLNDCISNIQTIAEKMSSNKKRGSFFGSFLTMMLVLGCFGVVVETIYKVQKGRPEDSSFRKINNGIVLGLTLVDARFQENFPEYHKKVADVTAPYVILVKDLGIIVLNALLVVKEVVDGFVAEKLPIVVKSIDTYAPGLIEHSQKAFINVCSTSALYFNRSVDYLQKEVFVGQLSPENMQRVVIEALNTTSLKATEYYHWLYEKVQTSIK